METGPLEEILGEIAEGILSRPSPGESVFVATGRPQDLTRSQANMSRSMEDFCMALLLTPMRGNTCIPRRRRE